MDRTKSSTCILATSLYKQVIFTKNWVRRSCHPTDDMLYQAPATKHDAGNTYMFLLLRLQYCHMTTTIHSFECVFTNWWAVCASYFSYPLCKLLLSFVESYYLNACATISFIVLCHSYISTLHIKQSVRLLKWAHNCISLLTYHNPNYILWKERITQFISGSLSKQKQKSQLTFIKPSFLSKLELNTDIYTFFFKERVL